MVVGDPVVLSKDENNKWNNFLEWIEENGLESLPEGYSDLKYTIGFRFL